MVFNTKVYGVDVDPETRCAHYRSAVDIIAIKFKCCGRWYPCFECHAAVADHEPVVWPKTEADEKAVLCGVCGRQLSIREYVSCDPLCPSCGSEFNPGCRNHYHLYFEMRK